MNPGLHPHETMSGTRPSRGDHVALSRAVASNRIIESPDILPMQGVGGTALILKPKPVARQPAGYPLSLTWSINGNVATLRAGYLLMRGVLTAVPAASFTLADSHVFAWLQFSTSPGIAPAPSLQFGSAWPTVNLGIHGWWPMAEFFTETTEEGDRYVSDILLHHLGGNVPYPMG